MNKTEPSVLSHLITGQHTSITGQHTSKMVLTSPIQIRMDAILLPII